MYQQDFDAVKSRVRGLWTQYGTGEKPRAAEQQPRAAEQQPRTAEPPPEGVEELLLFPTFAYRDERLKVWRVQVRGWAFCHNPSTRRVRWAATLMRRFIRIQAGGAEDQMLLSRVSHLLAGPPACEFARVAMAGIAEPAAFELHTQHEAPRDARGRRNSNADPPQAVNLLDAPLELTSRFGDSAELPRNKASHAGHRHDRLVRQESDVEPAIMQKTLQIDAFAWQTLALDEGRFSGEILVGFNELEWLLQSFGGRGSRRLIELRGMLPGQQNPARIAGVAHLVEPQGVSIVSDIDDTIKASNITAEKRILLETVFARPLEAVPGMAELYRGWYTQGAEFHYVSNSPWQLYPSLDGFFHANRFPPGSAHLRNFDPSDLLSVKNYTGTPQMKRDTIEQLFATFPERKFVLVGDCGEQDLETYSDLVRRYPGRVVRIYIRDLFAPLRVPTVTTHTDVADKVGRPGGIPYGIVRARTTESDSSRGSDGPDSPTDLIDFSDKRVPPELPPKPAGLRGKPISEVQNAHASANSSRTPPPKPPRSAPNSVHRPETAHIQPYSAPANPRPAGIQHARTDSAQPGGVQRANSDSPHPASIPRPETVHTHPASIQRVPTQQQLLPGGWAPNMPPETLSATELLQVRVRQLRMQAQQWLAFYAQQFYVAPTRSFLRHAQTFMPTLEHNMRIMDYDAIAAPDPDNPPVLADIPEPPPPEAQLARTERRLLLWKRYLACTRALPPRMCRLFVDASDIRQDTELLTVIFPKHTKPQL